LQAPLTHAFALQLFFNHFGILCIRISNFPLKEKESVLNPALSPKDYKEDHSSNLYRSSQEIITKMAGLFTSNASFFQESGVQVNGDHS
jgi:hypothetical protein